MTGSEKESVFCLLDEFFYFCYPAQLFCCCLDELFGLPLVVCNGKVKGFGFRNQLLFTVIISVVGRTFSLS